MDSADDRRGAANRVRLSDLAARVGLSTSAVSLALRGSGRVSPRTVERVREAALQMGYIYNRAAAGLRAPRADAVAVCINDLANPVFIALLRAIEATLQADARIVLLADSRESPVAQERFIRLALEQGAAGLILCPAAGSTAAGLSAVIPAGFPVALISRAVDGLAAPHFVCDDHAAGALMAARLVGAGRRRLAWLGGGQATSTARLRSAGFLAEARALQAQVVTVPGPTTRAFGRQAAAALLAGAEAPDGIGCFGDLIALGALAGCRDAGRTPGRDVAVVGCDDIEEAAFAEPGLASVRMDVEALGRQAAAALMDAWAGRAAATHPQPPPPSFIARASLGPPGG